MNTIWRVGYESSHSFLYFIHRLLSTSNDAVLHNSLEPVLKERVQERIGTEGDVRETTIVRACSNAYTSLKALAVAMRIIVCASFGIRSEVDLRALLPLQQTDGGWAMSWIYRMGSSGAKIGSRGLATAFAISAVEAANALLPATTSKAPPSPRKRRILSSFAEASDQVVRRFWRRRVEIR
jgi:hypothetical protein